MTHSEGPDAQQDKSHNWGHLNQKEKCCSSAKNVNSSLLFDNPNLVQSLIFCNKIKFSDTFTIRIFEIVSDKDRASEVTESTQILDVDVMNIFDAPSGQDNQPSSRSCFRALPWSWMMHAHACCPGEAEKSGNARKVIWAAEIKVAAQRGCKNGCCRCLKNKVI